MLDIKFIRQNPDLVRKTADQKNIKLDVDRLLSLDSEIVSKQQVLESLRAERNKNADEMKMAGGKPDQALINNGREIKEKIQKLEEEFEKMKSEFDQLMLRTPTIPSEDTPVGADESGNVEIKRWYIEEGADPKRHDFTIKDHIELGTSLDILDLERGVKTSGFRGYYLKNEGALMHLALMQFGMEKMVKHGFTPMVTPTLVKKEALIGSGHFPFDEENIYKVDSLKHLKGEGSGESKFLAGTSEPALINYYAHETLSEEQLPVKFVGFSPCYRSEIGSYGKDTKGIYRIHEFFKIEQVVICKNDIQESDDWHQTMLSISEELLQELKLPYRVLQLCTGDMGAGKYKMFDIETWMPSREGYGETHSASNLLDWQARRLNLRVKDKEGNKYYPYLLNNTVIASPRILIAIWENYQQADGSIRIPEALQKYIGKEIIAPR